LEEFRKKENKQVQLRQLGYITATFHVPKRVLVVVAEIGWLVPKYS